MKLPLLQIYPYRLSLCPDTGAYKFTADHGISYFITLTPGSSLGALLASPLREHGIIVGLALQDPTIRETGTDPRIEATMAAVIEQILTEPENIVLWICSPDKQQQRARNVLFDRWYRHYRQTGGPLDVLKKDVQTSPGEFASVLYQAENSAREQLEILLLEEVDKF